jgi:predicted lipoprotein with Yx(FWY)xxD motif
MHRRPFGFLAFVAAIPVIALVSAACGSGGGGATASSGSPTTTAGAPPTTANGQPATIGVASTKLGQILVDSQGRTLYLFKKDTTATSTCSGACAAAWPPIRATGQPTAGTGVNASLLGTSPRSDGEPQVTYNGHPVYLFVKDEKPGDTNGEEVTAFGAEWDAVTPAGNAAEPPDSDSASATTSAASASGSNRY